MTLDHNEKPLIEDEKSEILAYDGTLEYYFRQAGLEEGAHALFYISQKNKGVKGQKTIENATLSIKKIDPEKSKPGSEYITIIQNAEIEELSKEHFLALVTFQNDEITSFNGDIEQATRFLITFIEGVMIPIKRVLKGQRSGVKLGLAIPKPGTQIYNFFYNHNSNTIFVNRIFLEKWSEHPADTEITQILDNSDYNDQWHEQRALLWQIKDAKELGHHELAKLLESQYRKHG